MKWTKHINTDKPHRCPECHAVAERAWKGRYGPRTVFSCERDGIKWRATARGRRFSHSRNYRIRYRKYIGNVLYLGGWWA